MKINQLHSFLQKIFTKYPFSIVFGTILLGFFLFGGDSWLEKSLLLKKIEYILSYILGLISSFLLQLLGFDVSYNVLTQHIGIAEKEDFSIIPFVSAKYYIIIVCVFSFFFRNKEKSILYLIYGIFLLLFFSFLKLAMLLLFDGRLAHQLSDPTNVFIKTLMIVLVFLKFSLFDYFSKHIDRVSLKIKDRFSISIIGLFIIIATFIYMHRTIDIFANYGSFDWLLKSILWLSQQFMFILGYSETIITNHYLYLGINYVSIGAPCLGIGIMSSVSLLILLIRSPWLNKILYIFFSMIVMIFMNSIRVVFLLIHLYKNQSYQLAMDAHDLSNYFFYIVVFLLFLGYILWFQYVPLFRGKVGR